jgi:polar amino acid transport system permease protein
VFWPYLREGFWYVAFALTLSVSAYVGEVLRGGLRAVPRGELEAARAYGMRPWLVLRRVWMPRALQMLRPTLAGESVMLLKATALASTVAVTDLLGAANLVRAQTLRVYEPLLVVAVIYIILAIVIEQGFARIGKTPQRQA